MNNKVTIIKLGGGLIAPKDRPMETPDYPTLERLIKEIADAGKRAIVVTGSGNFGHGAVKKFGIGNLSGVKKVREIAKKIGKITADRIDNSRLVVTHNRPWKIVQILNAGITPVIYGDVMDIEEIWSGEKIIEIMIPELAAGGWMIEKIIQASREDGVWNSKGEIIPEINKFNWEEVKKEIVAASSIDVTGGMMHKVEESLVIAEKYGIKTLIINGGIAGRLKEAIRQKTVTGTLVLNSET
jgi:isopentenyl phosphate kinase